MPRTVKEIQEEVFKLCDELREVGKASEAKGFHAVPYYATQAVFAAHRLHVVLEALDKQLEADKEADLQLSALNAMQRQAGAYEVAK